MRRLHPLVLPILLTALASSAALATPRYVVIPLAESQFRHSNSYASAINETGAIAGSVTSYSSDGDDTPVYGFSLAFPGARTATILRGPQTNDWEDTYPTGINAGGQIVGRTSALNNGGPFRAFVANGGVMTDIGSLDGDPNYSTDANAINDAGQIVGRSHTVGAFHAFLYSGGVMTDINPHGDTFSTANAINNRGEIAGSTGNHAFLYSGGVMHQLSALDSSATGMNNHGEIVGTASFQGDNNGHAFLYAKGKMTDLGTLGGPTSAPAAINDHGEIVGRSDVKKSNFPRAFFSTGDKMIDLNTLIPASSKWTVLSADSINDGGLIVGYGTEKGSFRTQALLIAPVPTLTVIGGTSRVTHQARLTIRGRADRSVARVTYSRKKNRNFSAHGVAHWHFTPNLHPGKNVITVVARGIGGNVTRAHIIITRS